MNVEIFTLCDQYKDLGNQQNIDGIFDTMYVDINKPIILPNFIVVTHIRIEDMDKGEPTFNFRIIDPDGHDIINPLESSIDLAKYAKRTSLIRIGKSYNSLKLPSVGRYSVTLNISGKDAATIPLYIKQLSKKK